MAANQIELLKKQLQLREKWSLFRTNRRVKRQHSIENYIKIQAATLTDVYNNINIPHAKHTLRDVILGYYGDLMQWFGSLPGR